MDEFQPLIADVCTYTKVPYLPADLKGLVKIQEWLLKLNESAHENLDKDEVRQCLHDLRTLRLFQRLAGEEGCTRRLNLFPKATAKQGEKHDQMLINLLCIFILLPIRIVPQNVRAKNLITSTVSID